MNIKRIKHTALILGVLILGSLFLFSCMGEPGEPRSIKWLLKAGKVKLEEGEGSIAYNYFAEALEREPNNREALYGVLLALDLRVFANIDGIIDLISGATLYEPNYEECIIACESIDECNLYEEAWTTKETCLNDCPFGLQEEMFETMIDGSSCAKILKDGLEWVNSPDHDQCVQICEDLDLCGLINPPVTFSLQECIDHCPGSYVMRHSSCYLAHLGECNGNDRTCYEHITVGLQILFREIGAKYVPLTSHFGDIILSYPDDYDYRLENYIWELVDPPTEIDWTGRYDHGYVYLSKALAHVFQFVLLAATSVNLEMNFPALDIQFNYGNPQTAEEWLKAIIHYLEVLLYDPIFPLGFQIYDEPWAYEQILDSGKEIGHAFENLALMFNYMFNDTDKQVGKALAYDDVNYNFHWDADETWTVRGLGITINREQAEAVKFLSEAIAEDFLNHEPVQIEAIERIFRAFDLDEEVWVTDLIEAWYPDGIDLAQPFYDPQQNGFRDLLEVIVDKLYTVLPLVAEGEE